MIKQIMKIVRSIAWFGFLFFETLVVWAPIGVVLSVLLPYFGHPFSEHRFCIHFQTICWWFWLDVQEGNMWVFANSLSIILVYWKSAFQTFHWFCFKFEKHLASFWMLVDNTFFLFHAPNFAWVLGGALPGLVEPKSPKTNIFQLACVFLDSIRAPMGRHRDVWGNLGPCAGRGLGRQVRYWEKMRRDTWYWGKIRN